MLINFAGHFSGEEKRQNISIVKLISAFNHFTLHKNSKRISFILLWILNMGRMSASVLSLGRLVWLTGRTRQNESFALVPLARVINDQRSAIAYPVEWVRRLYKHQICMGKIKRSASNKYNFSVETLFSYPIDIERSRRIHRSQSTNDLTLMYRNTILYSCFELCETIFICSISRYYLKFQVFVSQVRHQMWER